MVAKGAAKLACVRTPYAVHLEDGGLGNESSRSLRGGGRARRNIKRVASAVGEGSMPSPLFIKCFTSNDIPNPRVTCTTDWLADLGCQNLRAGRRPSLAAMVTNSGRESAFILRIT
jgi:hypothetical protein